MSNTIEIPLSKGQVAIIDAEDFERVSRHSWYALFVKSYSNGGQYVARSGKRNNGKLKQFLLHRFIMNAPKGCKVDHIDRNPLNCTRKNLRIATNSQNSQNVGIRSDNSTGFKGVSVFRRLNKFRASISLNGITLSLGLHNTPEDAAKAYDKKAKELFGEFAFLNFPDCDLHAAEQAETNEAAEYHWSAAA